MREFFHTYKRNHRRIILSAGLLFLYALVTGTALLLGMNENGIWIIGGFFVIVGLVMEAGFEQH